MAIGGLASSALGAFSQHSANQQNTASQQAMNAQQLQWAREQSALQRQWALDDYNTVNAYNHPLQAMQRLKEAGLNPNLIYGNGSGAAGTATMVKNTSPLQPNMKAPQVEPLPTPDIGGQLGQMYSMKKMQAETDNLKEQNKLMQIKQLTDTQGLESGKFKLELQKELRDQTITSAKLGNEQRLAATNQTLQNISQSKQAFPLEQKLRMAKNEHERQLIENAGRTGQLQELDLKLRRMGVNPNDFIGFRILIQNLEQLKKSLE